MVDIKDVLEKEFELNDLPVDKITIRKILNANEGVP